MGSTPTPTPTPTQIDPYAYLRDYRMMAELQNPEVRQRAEEYLAYARKMGWLSLDGRINVRRDSPEYYSISSALVATDDSYGSLQSAMIDCIKGFLYTGPLGGFTSGALRSMWTTPDTKVEKTSTTPSKVVGGIAGTTLKSAVGVVNTVFDAAGSVGKDAVNTLSILTPAGQAQGISVGVSTGVIRKYEQDQVSKANNAINQAVENEIAKGNIVQSNGSYLWIGSQQDYVQFTADYNRRVDYAKGLESSFNRNLETRFSHLKSQTPIGTLAFSNFGKDVANWQRSFNPSLGVFTPLVTTIQHAQAKAIETITGAPYRLFGDISTETYYKLGQSASQAIETSAEENIPFHSGPAGDVERGVVDIGVGQVGFWSGLPYVTEFTVRDILNTPSKGWEVFGEVMAFGMATQYDAAKDNPVRFATSTIGTLLLPYAPKTAKSIVATTGKGIGITRTRTYGFREIPHKSLGDQVQTILESDRINGVRATASPINRFLHREILTRDPRHIGDVPAGQSISAQGVFMTISSKKMESYGTYFLRRSRGGIRGILGGKRVWLHEDIRTVKIPESLKTSVYKAIKERGEFTGFYDSILRYAIDQSKKFGEPIAVPSPKRSIGHLQPENEAYMVIASQEAAKITQTQFAGITSHGTIIKQIRLGRQKKIQNTRLDSIKENLIYNWQIGHHGLLRFYNKNLLEAMASDAMRKSNEIFGSDLSYPGSFAGHGLEHIKSVYNNLAKLRERSPTLQKMISLDEMWLRAKWHDMSKLTDLETEPYPHGFAIAESIRRGYLNPSDISTLSTAAKKSLIKDIRHHTSIIPGISAQGIITKLLYRPSESGKALATADRLDLVRFGIKVNENKLFKLPEESLSHNFRTATKDIFNDLSRFESGRGPRRIDDQGLLLPSRTGKKLDRSYLTKSITHEQKYPDPKYSNPPYQGVPYSVPRYSAPLYPKYSNPPYQGVPYSVPRYSVPLYPKYSNPPYQGVPYSVPRYGVSLYSKYTPPLYTGVPYAAAPYTPPLENIPISVPPRYPPNTPLKRRKSKNDEFGWKWPLPESYYAFTEFAPVLSPTAAIRGVVRAGKPKGTKEIKIPFRTGLI